MNNKGGVGKTTTVCAVGASLARMGKRILFIDLDSQANLTSITTDTDPSLAEWDRTIKDAFVGGPEFGLPIRKINDFMDIVPSDLSLSNFEVDTSGQQTREWMLADLLEPYRDQYDYILIDCPPALGLISYIALVAADYLIIVANTDGLSHRGVDMVVQLYNRVKENKRMNPDLEFLGLVVTRYKKDNISELILSKYKKTFGVDLLEPIIHMDTKLVQMVTFRKSIFELEPKGRAAEEYSRLAAEIIQRIVIK